MSFLNEGIEKIQRCDFTGAFSDLEKGFFSQADTDCACYLAQMFYDKKITPRTNESLMKAMLLWTVTASRGKPSSLHKLGIAYQDSHDRAVKVKGFEMLRKACEAGYPLSSCVLGVICFNEKKYDEACIYFEKYDDIKNDKDAYYIYGCSLLKKGNPDIDKAVGVLEYCAKVNNDIRAAEKLYELFNSEDSIYVKCDKNRAIYYKELQAELGDKNAYGEIAKYHFQYTKDFKKAIEYFEKSRPNIDAEGYRFLGEIYLSEKYKNLDLAEVYARKSVGIEKEKSVLFLLGKILYEREKLDEALIYFLECYDVKNLDFQDPLKYIAVIYSKKEDGPNAYRYSLLYEKQIGEIDCEPQLYIMADAYLNGKYGADHDINKAKIYLNKLSKSDKEVYKGIACLLLGDVYSQDGKSFNSAVYYYSKAVKLGNVDAYFKYGVLMTKAGNIMDAVSLLSEAYRYGSKEAAEYLSGLYMDGFISGVKDKKNAKRWKDLADKL